MIRERVRTMRQKVRVWTIGKEKGGRAVPLQITFEEDAVGQGFTTAVYGRSKTRKSRSCEGSPLAMLDLYTLLAFSDTPLTLLEHCPLATQYMRAFWLS